MGESSMHNDTASSGKIMNLQEMVPESLEVVQYSTASLLCGGPF
jgi:hypothetical protein